jgi:biopolymer transport protein ExbD
MGLRTRNREINGEEAMQSMTDIIFILLMFFLITSTLVHPSALPLSLPSSAKAAAKPPVTNERLPQIGVTASGTFIYDDRTTDIKAIKSSLETMLRTKKDLKIVVAPDRKAPIEKVVQMLDFAQVKGIQVVLAADNE